MKLNKLYIFALLFLAGISFTGCTRTSDDVWDDTRTSGRHFKRALCSLGGKHGDSRQVMCREDFMPPDAFTNWCPTPAYTESSFIPLNDNSPDASGANFVTRAAREIPGDPGSSLPGIQAFHDPALNPQLSGIFRNVHFEYNNNLIKGQDNYDILKRVGQYLRSNPNTYIFVEGHCDERGAEEYNFALGSRRANTVRDFLVQQGVSANNIFTISYGKDRPLVYGSDETSWAENRRAEFKIYQR